jgi:transcriptional regulator with XRE-family HTH domain
MNLNSRKSLIDRIRRGRTAREQLVESHVAKTIAYQICATRDRLQWSQERLAQEVDMNQNAISRLESPNYGKLTLTTLKRIAAALDVALVVRLVPFGEFIDWISNTPRIIQGLDTEALAVPTFAMEEEAGGFSVNHQFAKDFIGGMSKQDPTIATSTISAGASNEFNQRNSSQVDLAFRHNRAESERFGSLTSRGSSERSLQVSEIPDAGRGSACGSQRIAV